MSKKIEIDSVDAKDVVIMLKRLVVRLRKESEGIPYQSQVYQAYVEEVAEVEALVIMLTSKIEF